MRLPNSKNIRKLVSIKSVTGLLVLLFIFAFAKAGFITKKSDHHNIGTLAEKNDTTKGKDVIPKDSAASVAAFMNVYRVLMSPRCMNCHPSGDVPLQGDDSHLHTMLPRRGKEGKGIYAMKCTNCHQPTHVAGLHTPPGSPNWHLPPADMKMVFQGKTPNQLAKQIIDPKQNGGKNMEQLLEHAHDELVLYGWNPGEGRTLPPISHEEFVKEWTTWIKSGAFAPSAKIKAPTK